MKRNGRKDDEQLFEATVYRAVRSLGWLLPQSEREVAAIELDEERVELPPALRDPMTALERRRSAQPTEQYATCDDAIVAELAQAARQGSAVISEDVAERMRRDREAAEREAERIEND